MGSTVSRIQERNFCVTQTVENKKAPRIHFKCRYHDEDEHCVTDVYTRTKDIKRYPVPFEKIQWNISQRDYKPFNFTSAKILTKDGATYKDPDFCDKEFENIEFNKIDRNYNCDRQSHHGIYQFFTVKVNENKSVLVPRNPVGRTGLSGRGHLGRWGCNHAADPIVTTWSKDSNGEVIIDPDTNKPVLKFVAIQRRDTKEWAIPGGMRDPGEMITKTLVREFAEEALDYAVKYDKNNKIDTKAGELENKLNSFFRNGTMIYKGYVDDPRNTDNAWMETIACNFHDETGDLIGKIKLKGGDDADHAQWIDLNSNLKLFASHIDFLEEVASLHSAHW